MMPDEVPEPLTAESWIMSMQLVAAATCLNIDFKTSEPMMELAELNIKSYLYHFRRY